MSAIPTPCAVLFAKDVRKLANFYATVFDMEISEEEQTHELLTIEGFELVIHGIPQAVARQIEISSPPIVREDSAMKICLPVESLADARRIVEANGGQLAAKSKEWEARGFRACDGYDPEGNVFQARQAAG